MEKYEVNVLTRKGGWKKLTQDTVKSTDHTSSSEIIDKKNSNKTDNLKISINSEDEAISYNEIDDNRSRFSHINEIINELQEIESKKKILLEKLETIEISFNSKKQEVSSQLEQVKKEFDLYQKTINLIKSIKNL